MKRSLIALWVVSMWVSGLYATQPFTIHLKQYAGSEVLRLDSSTYHNALGQAYTVSKVKYYISDIKLSNATGAVYTSTASYLINKADSGSGYFILTDVPDREITQLDFIIGVDSVHNCSGVQQDALDPMNGMFWAWNTGYIFFKVEGRSPASTAPAHTLEYHIGGYREPNNCIRNVHLELPSRRDIYIKVDIAAMLQDVNFAILPTVTDHHHATEMADRYAKIFSLLP